MFRKEICLSVSNQCKVNHQNISQLFSSSKSSLLSLFRSLVFERRRSHQVSKLDVRSELCSHNVDLTAVVGALTIDVIDHVIVLVLRLAASCIRFPLFLVDRHVAHEAGDSLGHFLVGEHVIRIRVRLHGWRHGWRHWLLLFRLLWWTNLVAMVLDVSINDSFLNLVHSKACLCRNIEVVANKAVSRQRANAFLVPFSDRGLNTVLLGEDVADEGLEHVKVVD